MQNLLLSAELGTLGVCRCRIYYFWQTWGHWACVHAEFLTIGRTGSIGCVPMQNILLLAELGALGVCPCSIYYCSQNLRYWACQCRIYYFWQNWEHWTCAHAEFLTFGETEGIGRVSMQNLLLLAELKASGITFSRTGNIGRVPMQNLLLGQNWEDWACAHAEFITIGRTEGIGCVPMQN